MNIQLATEKLKLLLDDLKIHSEAEKREGKSYFNTQLFSIRVNEIYKLLKDSDIK